MSPTPATTGRWHVVVTGASSGIGRGLAERFAARGADLVLVARRTDRLEELAARLRAPASGGGRGVDVVVLGADLSDTAAPGALTGELARRGLRVGGLVNCAGFGTAGPLRDDDPERIAAEVAVDVTAPTLLTRLLLPDLLDAPAGVLLNVSSTAGAQPVPNLAVYAACKAYLTSLTAAVWRETRGSRLRVLALCPGPVDTEFVGVGGSDRFTVGSVMTVDAVVDAAFAALDARRGPVVYVGAANRLRSLGARLAPLRATLEVGHRATRRPGD